MRVTGARVALGPDRAEKLDLAIRDGRVSLRAANAGPELDLRGFLLLPGLINAHDHLEFNLFPKLGGAAYSNAQAWANDIYRPGDSPVREHLAVPKRTRLLWGGLKNLFSGVTTVAHHNPVDAPEFGDDFPVRVVKKMGWAHSLDFSADLAERYRETPADWPFLLHAAEGIDAKARAEIAKLDELGVLSDRTVLIHAIGLDRPGLALVKSRHSGIVWCPSSNLNVYGRTLDRAVFEAGIDTALGTDSAMTAAVDLIDEIGVARRACGLDARTLYEMVTTRAAALLRLRDGEGRIRDGGVADLIAVGDRGQSPAEALQEMTPAFVMVRGTIRLASEALAERLPVNLPYRVALEGRDCWRTGVDLPALLEETSAALGGEYRLAGRRVSP